ncbi:hypothetical protein GCM10025886_24060 [Tetragenococcus halophilus subsp. flandriensis]|nr:hypothetical protein GCM10025886_24060 [Tetragenococcus halophilus subsp. flandriensis]
MCFLNVLSYQGFNKAMNYEINSFTKEQVKDVYFINKLIVILT